MKKHPVMAIVVLLGILSSSAVAGDTTLPPPTLPPNHIMPAITPQ